MTREFCPHCMRDIPQGSLRCPWCGQDARTCAASHQLPVGTVLVSPAHNSFLVGVAKVTQEENIEICKLLEKAGADSIQLTGRTISYAYEEMRLNPFVDYANKLTNELNIPVILGGNLREMSNR